MNELIKYTFSIIQDTNSGKVNSRTLNEDINNSGIDSNIDRIDTNGDELCLYFDLDLTSTEETLLTSIVLNHDSSDIIEEDEVLNVKSISNAFADKVTSDGKKLYRRKHGVLGTISANSSGTLQLIVPYTEAKINKIELANCKFGDTVDLKIYDTPTGAVSTIPNYMLNQFGFDVIVPDGFYVDESNYDADLIQDMKVEITYKTNSDSDLQIGMNVTLHEMI